MLISNEDPSLTRTLHGLAACRSASARLVANLERHGPPAGGGRDHWPYRIAITDESNELPVRFRSCRNLPHEAGEGLLAEYTFASWVDARRSPNWKALTAQSMIPIMGQSSP